MFTLQLQYKMPDRYGMEKWEMVYSTTRHGISINTFYTKVAKRAPTLIVVEDVNHHVCRIIHKVIMRLY